MVIPKTRRIFTFLCFVHFAFKLLRFLNLYVNIIPFRYQMKVILFPCMDIY